MRNKRFPRKAKKWAKKLSTPTYVITLYRVRGKRINYGVDYAKFKLAHNIYE